MTHSEDDIMALVFGGATVEKTTTISSSHDIDSTHIERTITVTKSFTHDADGDHVTVEVHREVGAEDHGEEIYKHGSATFQAHVETDANGERHLQLDGIDLHRDIELPNGHEIGVEVHLREAPAAELGDRSPSRLSTATDATSILADTYHVHHDEQEVSVHLGDEEHHERDPIPFRTAQQDALVAQFKELHAPPLPTSAPPSEHVSRRGTYIEETSILDDPIEIDREHELERIRIEAERVAELKRTLSKASEVEHHHHHHRAVEDYSSDEEGSVVPLSATHYEFDDRASIARTESFISQQSKRDSIDVYHEHEHHAHPVAEKIAEFEIAAEIVERKLSAEHHNMNSEPAIGHGASVTSLNVIAPVTSPITESVFMSPVSPVPAEGNEYDSQHSSLNPRFSGPHIRDSIKAVEVLEHEHEHHHHHHHHHEHVARHDSITSAGAVVRALEEMDNALQHHSSASIRNDSSSVPPSPAPSRDEGAYSLNGSVRHKHHLYERLDSYSRASTPSGPPPPVPLWDLIKEEEIAREENVRDAPAPLHRAAPLSHLEEISSKNSVTTGSVHHHEEAVEAVALAHHIHHHHDSASLQGSVRSVGSRYGSKHSLAQSNGIGGGAVPAAVVVGAGVAPIARKYTADSNHSSCKSRGTSITLVEDGARSRGSTLTEANVNGVHVHEHHHHPVVEAVAAHLIHEHIERRVEEEIAKEIIHHHLEHQSTIEYEHQKPVSALLSKFGGGEKKVYTKEEAAIIRREREAEEAVRAAAEHAAREAERRIAEEAAALAAATRAAEEARLAVIRAAEEEAARHAAQVAAAAAIHHHEQQQAAHHGHSRTASVVSLRSSASYHVPPTPHDVVPIASRRDSIASVRTTRSVMGHRAAASRDPFATLTRPPPQHYVMAGYTRNPMTSPSLVKKSPLHAAVDANKFSSVRVVRNVRGFIKEWGQKDFVPPARSPLSPTLAVWHEEGNASRRSSIISEGGQSLIGRPAHMEAAPRSSVWQTQIGVPPTPTDVVEQPALTPLTERRREYEQTAAITGLVEDKHHHGLPPMVNLLA